MIEFFPPAKQQQIRSVLAGVLRGVVSQRLLPRVGGGRVAAVEVMVTNARIADLIRESRAEEIGDAVAEGAFFDMQTFQQALIEHVLAGVVDREVAANAATNTHDFLVALEHAEKVQPSRRRGRAAGASRASCSRPPPAPTPRPTTRSSALRVFVRRCREAAARRGRSRAGRSRQRLCRRLRGRRAGAAGACRAPQTRTSEGSLLLPPHASRRRSPSPRSSPTTSCTRCGSGAGAAYGIPWQVLAAINKIESNFGRNMGPSSAGAIGWMQFMPDTWLRWGVDASATASPTRGTPTTPSTPPRGTSQRPAAAPISPRDLRLQPRGLVRRRRARARRDVRRRRHRGRRRLHPRPTRAGARGGTERTVADLSERLRQAESREHDATAASEAAFAHADAQELLSDELVAQQEAFQVEVQRAEATAEVERLRGELAAAETALESARRGPRRVVRSSRGRPSCCAHPGRRLRFPVGGGPSVVSVGHDHHDYPAADIAAPKARRSTRSRTRWCYASSTTAAAAPA